MKEIEKIAEHHSTKVGVFADDVKLYTKFNEKSDFSDLVKFHKEIKKWQKLLRIKNSAFMHFN